jgi:hypothetical protein
MAWRNFSGVRIFPLREGNEDCVYKHADIHMSCCTSSSFVNTSVAASFSHNSLL